VRILHVITGLEVGGAELMLARLVEELARDGHVSAVLSLRGSGRGPVAARLEAAGGRVLQAKASGALRACRDFRPDVVQGWMHHGNLAALPLGAWTGAPVFWSVHQSLHDLRYEKPRNRALIRLARALSGLPAGIVHVSRTSASQHARFGFDASRARVVPLGFDTARFHPLDADEKRATRARLGMEPHAQWVGLVARDEPKKDPALFLAAAARLAPSHPAARFLLLGRGMERTDHPLRALASGLGLSDRVAFRGETPDPAPWIASLEVLVSSSYTEAFPTVVGEAMASGVPCVVTDVGDSAYLLGAAGRVVPPRDAAALARALGEVLDLSDEARRALGEAGRARILTEFTMERVAARFLSLYSNRAAARADAGISVTAASR
jgi:glycosyltransferase involved in cell wall biosynthesis